jgi:hypothetical protein
MVDFTQYNAVFLEGGGISATFIPQDGSGAQQIQAIVMPPGMAEEVMGGAGTAVLRLWVDFQSLAPQPAEGDTFTVGAVTYVVARVEAEPLSTGGAVLKLRTQ